MGKREDYWRAYEIVKERLTVNGKPPKAKHVRDTIAGTAGGAEAVLASANNKTVGTFHPATWQVSHDNDSKVTVAVRHDTAAGQPEEAKADYLWIEAELDSMLDQPRLNGSLRDLLLLARRIAGYEALKANNDPAVK